MVHVVGITAIRGSRQAWLRAGVDLLAPRGEGAVSVGDSAWVCTEESGTRVVEQSRGCLGLTAQGTPFDAVPLPRAFPTTVLEHTADEGFVVTAPSRADVLAAAAEALGAIMVGPESVMPVEERVLRIDASDTPWPDDERLFAWLSEVLFHMDAHRFAIRRVAVISDEKDHLEGVLFGEPLDEQRHDVHGAIKAMTYHALEIGEQPDGTWRAQVVVDV